MRGFAALWVLAGVDVPAVGRWSPSQGRAAVVAGVVLLGAWPMVIDRPSGSTPPRWEFEQHHGRLVSAERCRQAGEAAGRGLAADRAIDHSPLLQRAIGLSSELLLQ